MNAKRDSVEVLLSNIAANLELVHHLVTRAELGKPWGDKHQAVNNMFISLEDLKEAMLVAPKPLSRHIVKRQTVKRKSRKKAA